MIFNQDILKNLGDFPLRTAGLQPGLGFVRAHVDKDSLNRLLQPGS